MKFLAVVPMVFGFWLGIRICKRKLTLRSIATAFLLGIIMRVGMCCVLNAAVLLFVAPEFLKFSEHCLKAVGINVTSTSDVLLWTLALNGVFNTLHVILSSTIAMVLIKAVVKALPSVAKKVCSRLRLDELVVLNIIAFKRVQQ